VKIFQKKWLKNKKDALPCRPGCVVAGSSAPVLDNGREEVAVALASILNRILVAVT
jgi:hypothetical protein